MNYQKLFTLTGLEEEVARFGTDYLIENIIACPDTKTNHLKPKHLRVCRFCGRDNENTKFRKVAHLIPQMLGNKTLLSDFECDDCNWLFGRFENDLAYSLGITRTLFAERGKERVPHFKSPKGIIDAKQVNFLGIESTAISRKDVGVSDFKIDVQSGETTINYEKIPYIPLNAYKTLIKIALSVMDEKDVAGYATLFAFLNGDAYDEKIKPFAKVLIYAFPSQLQMNRPSVFLFRKNNTLKVLPTHCLSLYFGTLIYIFFLPFFRDDIGRGVYMSNFQLTLPVPLYTFRVDEKIKFERILADLSSKEKMVGEKSTVKFQMDPNFFDNAISYDIHTGKEMKTAFNPEDILSINFVDHGTSIPIGTKVDHEFNRDRHNLTHKKKHGK